MNTTERYPVTASLFMLREIKHRQEQVNRGYQLLKRKAEALRFRGRKAAVELASVQAVLGHTLKEAYISLAAIKFTNGESNAMVLESIGEAQVRVQRVNENISGVSTVSLMAVEDTNASDALQYAGLGAGGHRTGEAKKAFREAVRILIKFASLRNTCFLLDDAIKSTLRKVNGIEKVILPKLQNTEKYILMEMDEREREDFHRLKMVKAKKVKAHALTQVKLGDIFDDVDEDIVIDDKISKVTSRGQEQITTIMRSKLSSTMTATTGDSPTCLPHYWDDDDLLF
ncbi:ATP synthase subunit D domain-containing protein [Phthorimaea operculella]|nr:ATP synthase subunit D domain-containing protein [Phthorimaea operculella]